MANEYTNIILSGTYKGVARTVTVYVSVDEEIISKKLSKMTPPTTSDNYTNGEKPTKLVDFLQVERRINIDGHLITDTGTDTASTAKQYLKEIAMAGGVVDVVYEGETITANFEKLQIKKYVSNGSEPRWGEVGYDVKFTLIVGEDI